LDAAQVQSAIAESTRSLVERGFVQPEPDNTLTLDSTIAAMMTVLARLSRSYFCGLATPHDTLARHLVHVRGDFAVELSAGMRGSVAWRSRYTLLPVDGVEGLSARVSHLWSLSDQSAAPGAPIQVEEQVLREATRAARGSASSATQAARGSASAATRLLVDR